MGHETLEILVRERHASRNHINPCTKTPSVTKRYENLGEMSAPTDRSARFTAPGTQSAHQDAPRRVCPNCWANSEKTMRTAIWGTSQAQTPNCNLLISLRLLCVGARGQKNITLSVFSCSGANKALRFMCFRARGQKKHYVFCVFVLGDKKALRFLCFRARGQKKHYVY